MGGRKTFSSACVIVKISLWNTLLFLFKYVQLTLSHGSLPGAGFTRRGYHWTFTIEPIKFVSPPTSSTMVRLDVKKNPFSRWHLPNRKCRCPTFDVYKNSPSQTQNKIEFSKHFCFKSLFKIGGYF